MDASRVVVADAYVFFTRSYSFLGKAIRKLQRGKGEAESKVNHVGLFVTRGPQYLEHAVSIEALARVRHGKFWGFYHGSDVEVAVYRDTTLTSKQTWDVTTEALRYRGRMYGFLKIPLHALDWALARAIGRQDVYAFRRVGRLDRYPICSYLVAKAFSAVDRNFGARPTQAQPDDMWDYVNAHPEKWECVLPLQKI